MKIYCALHKTVEQFTDREAEDLINGLYAEFVDALSDPRDSGGDPAPLDPFEILYSFCPLGSLGSARHPEMYAEHVENAHEARLTVERRERAAKS